jgi:hypothetical protein
MRNKHSDYRFLPRKSQVIFDILVNNEVDKWPRILKDTKTIAYTMRHLPTQVKHITPNDAARIFDELYGEVS